MAKPFKRRSTEPIPEGARIGKSRGKPVARWKDENGRACSAPVIQPSRGKYAGQARILVESARYYGEYVDGDGKTKRVCLYTDHDASEAELKRLVAQAERERTGLVPGAERRQHEPIDRHLDEFEETLRTTGNVKLRTQGRKRRKPVSDAYLKRTMREIRMMLDGCGFASLAEIRPEPVIDYLDKLRREGRKTKTANDHRDELHQEGRGAKTVNCFLTSLHGFVRWAIDRQRMTTDPLIGVPEYDEESDVRRKRRPLSPEQVVRLLAVAQERPRNGIGQPGTDEDRRRRGLRNAIVYKTLLLGGMRLGELTGLRRRDVNLDDGYLYISAELAKSSVERVVAMRDDLAEDLRRWFALVGEPAQNSPFLDVPSTLIRTLKLDLRDAEIPYKDDLGRQADLHSLRATVATWMGAVTTESVVGQHLGHGKMSITSRHYIKHGVRETRAALDKLAPLPIEGLYAELPVAPLRATGTTDATPAEYKGEYKEVGEPVRNMAIPGGSRGVGPNRGGDGSASKSLRNRDFGAEAETVADVGEYIEGRMADEADDGALRTHGYSPVSL